MMKQIIIVIAVIVLATACKSQKETATTYEGQDRTEQREKRDRRQGPPSTEEVFKMDVNNDGKLSKMEVKGRLLKRFSTIDADADGFITKTEFENAPKPKRGEGPPPRK